MLDRGAADARSLSGTSSLTVESPPRFHHSPSPTILVPRYRATKPLTPSCPPRSSPRSTAPASSVPHHQRTAPPRYSTSSECAPFPPRPAAPRSQSRRNGPRKRRARCWRPRIARLIRRGWRYRGRSRATAERGARGRGSGRRGYCVRVLLCGWRRGRWVE